MLIKLNQIFITLIKVAFYTSIFLLVNLRKTSVRYNLFKNNL